MQNDHVVPGRGQGTRNMSSQSNFIFYDQDAHVIEILFTAKNLRRRTFHRSIWEGDAEKVTGLLRFVPCLFPTQTMKRNKGIVNRNWLTTSSSARTDLLLQGFHS
jgi:hypothetical protein